MTSNSVIYAEIEKIYERNESSKRFITHLIRSYFPLENVTIVEKSGDKVICSITKKLLKGIDDISLDNITEQSILENVSFKLNLKKEESDINFSDIEQLAIQGSNTETYLTIESYIALAHFVCTSLKSDKRMEWLIRQMNIRPYFNKMLGIKPKPKNKTFNKFNNQKKHNTATTSLGDLDVLKQLRKRMGN